MTVPVQARLGQAIDEVKIDYSRDWVEQVSKTLRQNYSRAPYRDRVSNDLDRILAERFDKLSDLNEALLKWGCEFLGISTPLVRSRPLAVKGVRSERLLNVLRQLGATSYLSGPSAKQYLDLGLFEQAEIEIEFKTYCYAEYAQLHPPYDPHVSIVDLLMMTGPSAREYLQRSGARL